MPRKIVVVDDDRLVREHLARTLSDQGYEVRVVANGLRLISTLHVDRPDLILLDVKLSWIDGFELCRAIKKNTDYAGIPIIFISGKSSVEDRELGIECGAVDFLPKPLDSERLIERVKDIIGPP